MLFPVSECTISMRKIFFFYLGNSATQGSHQYSYITQTERGIRQSYRREKTHYNITLQKRRKATSWTFYPGTRVEQRREEYEERKHKARRARREKARSQKSTKRESTRKEEHKEMEKENVWETVEGRCLHKSFGEQRQAFYLVFSKYRYWVQWGIISAPTGAFFEQWRVLHESFESAVL